MIYEVSGDILLSEARAIAHGVAPNDNFATGLALSLREHWPALYKTSATIAIFTILKRVSNGLGLMLKGNAL